MKKTARRLQALVLSLVLAISLLLPGTVTASALSYSGSASYRSGPYYTALTKVNLTGNQRTDIVNVAKSQVGYQEGSSSAYLSGTVKGSNNYTEYGRWYGMQDMWCAMFVSWCANVANISTNIVPKHSYTPSGLNWFISRGQAYSRAKVAAGVYTPQPGDIIYFKSSRNTAITNHIGIVTGYSNGTVYTIEGNTSSATVSTNGGAVAAKSYSINNTYIVYICKPNYTGSSSGSSSGSSTATETSVNIPDNLKDWVFDAFYYANQYPDLKAAFGTDEQKLYDHFVKYGIKEGRQASFFFNVSYYRNSNSDLKAAFGNDNVAAFNHFVQCGQYENRQYSAQLSAVKDLIFDANFYAMTQPDVKAAYGMDVGKLFAHFMIYGAKEGRASSPVFYLSTYLKGNTDLKNTFGNNYWEALKHFVQYGTVEKRNLSPILDAKYYASKYSDLSSFSSVQAMRHFLDYGMREGRRGSALFDPDYYYNAHPDLAANGLTKTDCYMHYLYNGINEGRSTNGDDAVSNVPANLGDDFCAKISPVGTGKNLSLSDHAVITYSPSSAAAQVWRFIRQNDGSYKIVNEKEGLCLDVNGAASSSGAAVQVYADNGSSAQRWFLYLQNDAYVLKPACAPECALDVPGGNAADCTKLQTYTTNGTSAQSFMISPVEYLNAVAPVDLGSDFTTKITWPIAGKNLSLSGSNVILYPDSSAAAQQWRFIRQSDGSYKVVNQKEGKCLDVAGASSNSGTNIQVYTDNGSNAQRWFIYLKEGKYFLRPACAVNCVLDVTGAQTDDLTNIQLYSYLASSAQLFTLTPVESNPTTGVPTASQMAVMRNIIYAVETGGQVYGRVDYTSFVEAYTNSSAEHAITIGGGQWYGVEAKKLLNRIRTTYPATFAALDTAGIASDLDNCDWSTYRISKTSAKAKCIQAIISSPEGIQCQNALLDEQMSKYMEEARSLGVTDIDAQMMCANIRHQGGLSALKRVLGKTAAPYTLDNIYAALQTDTGNQVGAYRSRQLMVYNALKQYV
ncbi:MAG: RICIN domain-containing protein [Faecousia sp.]